ncbi:MAG: EAL domain-containing protein, partial [Anaerolineae bacterium]|nr:EAL domain-containing protein [Anaerolineae bacterium]
ATIELAHNLGMWIVAEGVKDRGTWEYLKTLDCDVAQGFYISEALPAQAFSDWLQSRDWSVRMAAG